MTRPGLLVSIAVIALGLASPARAADHLRSQVFASSCVLGCGPGIGWDGATAIDGSPYTAWSSVLHWTPSSGAEWLAYYWDAVRETDHVHIQGRVFEGRPIHLPPTIHVYYASGGSWAYLTSVTVPEDVSPRGLTITFPYHVMSNGVLLYADTLRAQPGTSYYYFQIAEVDAGLDQCDLTEQVEQVLSDWCNAVPNYRANVMTDTHYLYNSYVQIGLNKSFGGAAFQLFGADPRHNLIYEHGGAVLQLSLYGAGTNNEHLAPGISCPGFEAWPFNPLMTTVENCWWDGPGNDIQPIDLYQDAHILHMQAYNPKNMSKKTAVQDLFWAEAAHVDDGKPYVRIDYHIQYSAGAAITMIPHGQELPAIFPASGMHYQYTYVNDQNVLVHTTQPTTQYGTTLPGRTGYGPGPQPPINQEEWVGVCDQAGARCMTVATFSPAAKYLAFGHFNGYTPTTFGYIGAHGYFALTPGTEVFTSVYVFPYKYDQIVAGKTVRQWIADLKAAQ